MSPEGPRSFWSAPIATSGKVQFLAHVRVFISYPRPMRFVRLDPAHTPCPPVCTTRGNRPWSMLLEQNPSRVSACLCLYIGRSENQVSPSARIFASMLRMKRMLRHRSPPDHTMWPEMLKNRKKKVSYLWSTHTRWQYHCFDLPIQCKTVNQIFAPAS